MSPTAPRSRCPVWPCPNLRPCPVHKPTPGWEREARGTSHQRGYGAAWRKTRARVLRDRPFCESCGQPATGLPSHRPEKTRRLRRSKQPKPTL